MFSQEIPVLTPQICGVGILTFTPNFRSFIPKGDYIYLSPSSPRYACLNTPVEKSNSVSPLSS